MKSLFAAILLLSAPALAEGIHWPAKVAQGSYDVGGHPGYIHRTDRETMLTTETTDAGAVFDFEATLNDGRTLHYRSPELTGEMHIRDQIYAYFVVAKGIEYKLIVDRKNTLFTACVADFRKKVVVCAESY